MDTEASDTLTLIVVPSVGTSSDVENRVLSTEEKSQLSGISIAFAKLTAEATRHMNASDWIKESGKVKDLIDGFPIWDGPVLNALKEVYENGINRASRQDVGAKNKFRNRWNGIVSEVVTKRWMERLKGAQVWQSPDLDKIGIDGVVIALRKHEEEAVLVVIMHQDKSTSVAVPPGLHIIDPSKTEHGQAIGRTFDVDVSPSRFTDYAQYSRLQPGGDIYKSCIEEGKRIREHIIRQTGINPRKLNTYLAPVLIGVGMAEADGQYGWYNLMKMTEMDKDKRVLLRVFMRGIHEAVVNGIKID